MLASRPRLALTLLLALTILAGLGSRWARGDLPVFVAKYAGDTLWATMVFWILALIRPGAHRVHLAGAALAIAWTVEVSQLIRTPWLDAVRASAVGALALGQGFLWSDLACYAAGAALALAIDALVLDPRRAHSRG